MNAGEIRAAGTPPNTSAANRAEPDDLSPPWRDAAREKICFRLPRSQRPWNWVEADREEAATLWRVLDELVEYLNGRYLERPEHRIPPCWHEHGALVEELSTLFWSRWAAFESPDASPAGAESFNSYVLPGFLDRMAFWLGADRLRKCQAGRHEARQPEPAAASDEWALRRAALADADVALRPAPAPAVFAGEETASRAPWLVPQ